jgi:CubicO group peptidase (beta-lactamase class C family)
MKTLLVLSFLAGVLAMHAEKREKPWPAAAWPRSTPAAQGMDAAPLESLHAELAEGRHGYVDGMLVVRNGHLVFERTYPHDYAGLFEGKDPKRGPYNYYDPDWHPYYKKTDLHTLQSASKSITSVLVGIALRRGELPGTDVEARRYLTGFRTSPDPRQARITLRHLLTMTSGIRWDETTVAYTDPANSCARMEASPDWVQFVLDQPMAEEPGKTFVYNSGVTQLIAQVLARAAGKNPADYAVEHLFRPLGIERFYWKRTPTGLPPRSRRWRRRRGSAGLPVTATSGGCCRTPGARDTRRT